MDKIDLVISFDTTGSMFPVIREVERNVNDFVHEMFSTKQDLRIGIIAHGDYCDADKTYVTRQINLTDDEAALCEFIRTTGRTGGGDADECYEKVLNIMTEMNWRPDANKMAIVIGDASPHGVYYDLNKERLDWKEETDKLAHMGVQIFAVHALAKYRRSSVGFYETLADKTNGFYLTLDQFRDIADLIKASYFRKSSVDKLQEFINAIKESGRMTYSMDDNLKRLQGIKVEARRESKEAPRTSDIRLKEMKDLVAVPAGRFQVMEVTKNMPIREFVESMGIEFKRGRGFYELSKHEKVQQYKEVIMQDRETGEMFTGSQVREKLGLKPQCEKGGVVESLSSRDTKNFTVYVQSTSYNRKLIGGTTFLYEVPDLEDAGTTIERTVDTTPEMETTPEIKETPVEVTKPEAEVSATAAITETPKKTRKTQKKEKETIMKEEVTMKEAPATADKPVEKPVDACTPAKDIDEFTNGEKVKIKAQPVKESKGKGKNKNSKIAEKLDKEFSELSTRQNRLDKAIKEFDEAGKITKTRANKMQSALKAVTKQIEKINKLLETVE